MNLRIVVLVTISFSFCNKKTNKQNNEKDIKIHKSNYYQEDLDSIHQERILKKALEISKHNIKLDSFYTQYDQTIDSTHNLTTSIKIGKLFWKNSKHLYIKRKRNWTTFINIYKIKKDNIEFFKFIKQDNNTYINDSIYDVNGDGLKDYIVYSYPSSGCCLANKYDVTLFKENDSALTKEYQFINPTFYPKEKIIRGFGYASPNEVNLYKYKWNDFKVDTIEFINPNFNKKGEYIRTKHKLFYATEKDGVVLKSVPKEYHKINDFNWVIGDVKKGK